MIIATRSEDGSAMCPICEVPVPQVGEFCSAEHYTHFLHAVAGQTVVYVEDAPLDRRSQAWYVEQDEQSS